MATPPRRGEVWWIDLEPVRGHEQGGTRPALIMSADLFNQSPSDLVVVIPITTKERKIRSFLLVHPPEAGLKQISYIICDQIRTVSRARLNRPVGKVSDKTMREVERRIKFLLDLP